MYTRNKDGVVMDWNADAHQWSLRKATKRYRELTKHQRRIEKLSRRRNRR